MFSKIFQYWWVLAFLVIGGIVAGGLIMTDPVAINPTDKAMTIEIDKTSYTIPPNSPLTIKLSHGEHSVTMGGQDMGKFNFGRFDTASVINPSLSEFVVEEILYGSESYAYKLSNNTITIDGKKYTGPYTLTPKEIYIKKTWDYGVYDNAPQTVTTKAAYEIKKELINVQEFVKNMCYDGEKSAECE